MKKAIFIFGMGLLALTSANAKGNKADNSKTTDAVAAPTETKSRAGDTYYWFDVTSDGAALSDPSGIPLSQGQTATGECTGSQPEFCQRGYTADQTSISGGKRVINVPVEESAAEDHKVN